MQRLQERHTESSLILEILNQSVDMLCIGIKKDVTGYHSLARYLMKWGTVSTSRQAMQIQMYAWFSKYNRVTCLLDSRKSTCLQLTQSRLHKVTALALCYKGILYTHTFLPFHSFSRWVKVMIGVALKMCFSQVNCLSHKVESANPFYQTRCTCLLLLFPIRHTYRAEQREVFQPKLNPLTFCEYFSV